MGPRPSDNGKPPETMGDQRPQETTQTTGDNGRRRETKRRSEATVYQHRRVYGTAFNNTLSQPAKVIEIALERLVLKSHARKLVGTNTLPKCQLVNMDGRSWS